MGTGKSQNITITSSTNMSKEDIDKAVREAEQYAEQDKKQKEAVDTKNTADSMIFQAEKFLDEAKDKLPESDLAGVKGAVEGVRGVLNSGDVDRIKDETKKLETELQALAQKLSAAQAQQQGPADGGNADGGANGGEGGQYYDAHYDDNTQNK